MIITGGDVKGETIRSSQRQGHITSLTYIFHVLRDLVLFHRGEESEVSTYSPRHWHHVLTAHLENVEADPDVLSWARPASLDFLFAVLDPRMSDAYPGLKKWADRFVDTLAFINHGTTVRRLRHFSCSAPFCDEGAVGSRTVWGGTSPARCGRRSGRSTSTRYGPRRGSCSAEWRCSTRRWTTRVRASRWRTRSPC